MSLSSPDLQLLTSLTQLITNVVLPPDPLNCGLRNERGLDCPRDPNDQQNRHSFSKVKIEAWYGEFPWLASLRGAPQDRLDSPLPVCGGVLVHPQAVLVSAACHEEVATLNYSLIVRLADFRVNSDVDFGWPASDHSIRKAVYHPDYRRDGSAAQNDVGLLLLDHPATLGTNVGTVCLPWWSDDVDTLSQQWENTECLLAGWTDPRKGGGDRVTYEKIKFIGRRACQTTLRKLRRLGPFQQIHQSFACASADASCWADSGSALVCRNQRDASRWTLAGIVPGGRLYEKCEEVVSYTNIGYFAEWIKTTITAELSAFT